MAGAAMITHSICPACGRTSSRLMSEAGLGRSIALRATPFCLTEGGQSGILSLALRGSRTVGLVG
jgi:hypothetical protein